MLNKNIFKVFLSYLKYDFSRSCRVSVAQPAAILMALHEKVPEPYNFHIINEQQIPLSAQIISRIYTAFSSQRMSHFSHTQSMQKFSGKMQLSTFNYYNFIQLFFEFDDNVIINEIQGISYLHARKLSLYRKDMAVINQYKK